MNKILKTALLIASLAIAPIVLTACDEFAFDETSTTKKYQKESEKGKKEEKKEEKKETDSDGTPWCTIAAMALAAAALAMSIKNFYDSRAINERVDRHREEIDALRATILNHKQAIEEANSKASVNNRTFKSHVDNMEREIQRLSASRKVETKVPEPAIRQNSPTVAPAPKERHAYFGVPVQMSETQAYFRQIIESRDNPEARFDAQIVGNKATFKPLNDRPAYLNDIKTSATMKLAVVLSGCLPSEAQSMTLKSPGEAELLDSYWVITRQAEIVLNR